MTSPDATRRAGAVGRLWGIGSALLRGMRSPLTRRLLAGNLVAPVMLGLGLLFLDEYKDGLTEAELADLRNQGRLVAAAVGETAVVIRLTPLSSTGDRSGGEQVIEPMIARHLLRRLSIPADARVRLFNRDGQLIADSRLAGGAGTAVQVVDLPPPEGGWLDRRWRLFESWLEHLLAGQHTLERYQDNVDPTANSYRETRRALQTGEDAEAVRIADAGNLVLSAAIPVQYYRQVLGVVLITRTDANITRRVLEIRRKILQLALVTVLVTVSLSFYQAGTIARPIRRLSKAAGLVRRGKNRQHSIPDLTRRGDEIGDLSAALIDMTEALWQRMDAVEQFAADVAHEIKNPLTSLRSAVETVQRVKDPERQQRLLEIILHDVQRLDRLISDISDASRVDAELSRAEMEPMDLAALAAAAADSVGNLCGNTPQCPSLKLALPAEPVIVPAIAARLGRVIRNLLENAISFSPDGGEILVTVRVSGRRAILTVEDDGPGIPEGKEAAIFDRFYTERPQGEAFGGHSGLGLSISRQIVEAHGGTISAENRSAPHTGARFTVDLPLAPPGARLPEPLAGADDQEEA